MDERSRSEVGPVVFDWTEGRAVERRATCAPRAVERYSHEERRARVGRGTSGVRGAGRWAAVGGAPMAAAERLGPRASTARRAALNAFSARLYPRSASRERLGVRLGGDTDPAADPTRPGVSRVCASVRVVIVALLVTEWPRLTATRRQSVHTGSWTLHISYCSWSYECSDWTWRRTYKYIHRYQVCRVVHFLTTSSEIGKWCEGVIS